MKELNQNELYEVNGGEIDLDVNELVRQLNPYNIGKEFGRSVLYPYVWKPIKGLFN